MFTQYARTRRQIECNQLMWHFDLILVRVIEFACNLVYMYSAGHFRCRSASGIEDPGGLRTRVAKSDVQRVYQRACKLIYI